MVEDEKTESVRFELSPETINAFVETVEKIGEVTTQALSVVAEAFAEIGRKVSHKLKIFGTGLVDELLYAANDNPKWWHLYKHAKKARTRKKYKNKLYRQYLKKLEIAKIARESLND